MVNKSALVFMFLKYACGFVIITQTDIPKEDNKYLNNFAFVLKVPRSFFYTLSMAAPFLPCRRGMVANCATKQSLWTQAEETHLQFSELQIFIFIFLQQHKSKMNTMRGTVIILPPLSTILWCTDSTFCHTEAIWKSKDSKKTGGKALWHYKTELNSEIRTSQTAL